MINGLNYTLPSEVVLWLQTGVDECERENIWILMCSSLCLWAFVATVPRAFQWKVHFLPLQSLKNTLHGFNDLSRIVKWGHLKYLKFNSILYILYNHGCMRVWCDQYPQHHLWVLMCDRLKFRYMHYYIWSTCCDFWVFVTVLKHVWDEWFYFRQLLLCVGSVYGLSHHSWV